MASNRELKTSLVGLRKSLRALINDANAKGKRKVKVLKLEAAMNEGRNLAAMVYREVYAPVVVPTVPTESTVSLKQENERIRKDHERINRSLLESVKTQDIAERELRVARTEIASLKRKNDELGNELGKARTLLAKLTTDANEVITLSVADVVRELKGMVTRSGTYITVCGFPNYQPDLHSFADPLGEIHKRMEAKIREIFAKRQKPSYSLSLGGTPIVGAKSAEVSR